MNSETMNSKQAISLMALFIAGNAMITGNASRTGQDAWIALLLAGVLCLPLALICARIVSLFPETSFFDALYEIFGKIFGGLISLVFCLYALLIGVLATRNFTEFVHVVSFGKTPQLFVAVCLGVLCAYAVSKGLTVMGRGALAMFLAVAVMVVFTVLMLIPSMDPKNLLPVLGTPAEQLASGTLAWFTYPLAECVVLMAVAGGTRREQSRYRLYIAALCIAVGLLLLSALRNLLVFGGDIVRAMMFPSYIAARVIEIGGFVQRIEAFISANMLICAYVRISVCVFVASKGVARVFRTANYRHLAFPIGLLIAALSPLLFDNAVEMESFMRLAARWAIPLQAGLPPVIWLGAEIRARRKAAAQSVQTQA